MNKALRSKFLALAIVFPSLILGILGWSSIRSGMSNAESNYKSELIEAEKILLRKLDENLRQMERQMRVSLQRLGDMEPHLASLSSQQFPELPQWVVSLALFSEGVKIYPYQETQNINALNLSPFMSSFEKYLWQKEEQGRISKDHLFTRLQRNRNPNLSHLEKKINQIGLIRTYLLLNQKEKAIRQIRYLELDPAPLPLPFDLHSLLWDLEYQVYKKNGDWKRAVVLLGRVLTTSLQHQRKHPHLPTLISMLEDALSYEQLKPQERNYFYKVHTNLLFLKSQETAFQTHKAEYLFLETLTPYSDLPKFHQSAENLFWEFPFFTGGLKKRALIIVDQEKIREQLFQGINLKETPFNQFSVQVIQNSQKVFETKHKELSSLYNLHTLAPYFPIDQIRMYRLPESIIQKGATQRAILLYTLLGFSLIAIGMSATIGARTLRKERTLLEMKSNFLSSITHELKTPLTSIKMFAEMIQQGRIQTLEKAQQVSGMINQESDRLDLLISDILNYSRLEKGDQIAHFEVLNLSQLCREVCQRLQFLAKSKDQNLNWNIEPELHIHGDLRSLESLVQNLIDNAIKYSNKPGTIHLSLQRKEQRIRLSVKDEGIGISKSESAKIFNAFYRVGDEMTRETKGSGIGLAIVKKVAELHEAPLDLKSTLGEGTTISLAFKEHNHG